MASETLETPVTDDGAPAPRKKRSFPTWMRLGASLRKGSSDPRPVKLARLGVSGQGREGEVTPGPAVHATRR